MALACGISGVEAMDGKVVVNDWDGYQPIKRHLGKGVIIKCNSGNNRFLMVNRWELGNCSDMKSCRYLHVEYYDTEKRFQESKSKAHLTDEMRDMFCTLPESIRNFYDLRVLSICSFTNNYVLSREEICLKRLPDCIGSLANLRVLDLSSNDLRGLPESIGNLKNLEELYLSKNYRFSELPESIGNLESLKILELEGTDLETLPNSMENLTNLRDLSLSQATNKEGPHTSGVRRSRERIYVVEDYPSRWYRKFVGGFEEIRSLPLPPTPLYGYYNRNHDEDDNRWRDISSLNLSGKDLKQIPFGIHWITGLKRLDISNNQLSKIPHLLKNIWRLEELYIHNNPKLNHLPDFLWEMRGLMELKIDGKLIKDLPENAQISLEDKNLEDIVLDLTLTSKNDKKMSDRELQNKTGPYTVRLKKKLNLKKPEISGF